MARGRWGSSKVLEVSGTPTRLFPVPIRAASYLNGIQWGRLGTPEEATARTEMARMLKIYERFGACQQPLRYRDGRTVWTIVFPSGSRWASGPEAPGAWLAMLDNYTKNDRFKGFMNNGLEAPSVMRDIDGIIDRSLKNDKDFSESLIKEVDMRMSHVKDT